MLALDGWSFLFRWRTQVEVHSELRVWKSRPIRKICAKKTGISERNRTNISNRRRHIPVKYIPTKQDVFFWAASPLFLSKEYHPKNLEKSPKKSGKSEEYQLKIPQRYHLKLSNTKKITKNPRLLSATRPGKRTVCYWKWPSRNRGFTQLENGGSFQFVM